MCNCNTLVALLIQLVLIPFLVCSGQPGSGTHIYLEHSVEPGTFTYRDNITIDSLQSNAFLHQVAISKEDAEKLRILAKDNGFYQLRSIVTSSNGENRHFLSTVKACMLAEAGLDDKLSIFVDYADHIIGVALSIASTTTCEGADVPVNQLEQFVTTIYVRPAELGPVPDTASYIQKLEREKEAKERGALKDNRSFFAKYWMYIVPVAIVMIIMSSNPEAAQAAAGR